MAIDNEAVAHNNAPGSPQSGFKRGLGRFDSTMLVSGVMIGSGIFIVSAEMSRLVCGSGWLLLAWALTGVLTIAGALAYGELASLMPQAGGQYVYLRESYSPLVGFLYGWTLFTVIQTGTIAAVAIAFARFSAVLWPWISEEHYFLGPLRLSNRYAISFSSAQLVAVCIILLLTWINNRGLAYGKAVQNVFTVTKIGILLGVTAIGLLWGWNAGVVQTNFGAAWARQGCQPIVAGLDATSPWGLLVALCLAQTGSLFASDCWHNIAYASEEVKDPRRTVPIAMVVGAFIVIVLYLSTNVAYLVTLPLTAIQQAPSDRVGTAVLEAAFPNAGPTVMATAIMISTFGAINALILGGARAYYAMAGHGLFFRSAGLLNQSRVPGWALMMQGIWAVALVFPRTFDEATGRYGNLYSNLLDYVISAALLFYVLTVVGILRLRKLRPHMERPYKAFGYPVIPVLYIVGAGAILVALFVYRSSTTWPGMALVLLGVPVYWLFRRFGKASPSLSSLKEE